MTRKSSPIRCASPSRRSRVTPGRSSTSASFLPTRRLNSVDLPTLGRPTIATVGRRDISARPSRKRRVASSSPRPSRDAGRRSPIRGDPSLVVERVERRVGDDRRQRERRLGLDRRCRPRRRSGDANTISPQRIGQHQPVARQHRAEPGDRALLLLLVLEARAAARSSAPCRSTRDRQTAARRR